MVAVTLVVAGPVAEWHLDEAAAGASVTLSDASGNGRHGLTSGFGSAGFAGVVGGGRAFNGFSDWVSTGASTAFSPPGFTFRAWVKVLSLPAGAGWGVVASHYDGNYRGWYVGILASGRVALCVAGLPASAPWLVSSAALTPHRWYLLTVTYDGATREGAIHINGARDAAAVFAAFTPPAAMPFTLGRASWFDGYYLSLVMDEARLLAARQSPAEVLADYQSFPAPPGPPADATLAGDWRMNDPGGAVIDSSGNSRHATVATGAVVAGVSGAAHSFNGAGEYARVPAAEAFSPASFTVRFWVRLASLPESAGWGVALASYGGAYRGWYVGIHSSGRVILSVASLPSSSPWLLSAASLAVGRWHYVAATWEGATRIATIYVDGIVAAQAFLPGFTPDPAAALYFARASWYDGYYLNAAIDEARLESRPRTAAEILADYQSFPPQAPAPAAAQPAAEVLADFGSFP